MRTLTRPPRLPAMAATLLLLLLLLPAVLAATEDYCMAKDPRPFASFGTRAPYEVSGANLNDTRAQVPGCRAVHLWHLGRHGTRHGKASEIDAIVGVLPKLKARLGDFKANGKSVGLCDADVDNILKWYPNVDDSLDYQLTAQGQQDVLNMGRRFRARFPELFDGNSAANFKFRYDKTDRCIASSQWFYKGVFGEFPAQGEGGLDSLPDFYNRCPAYLVPIATDYLMADFHKFRKRPEWADMVKRVSARLGFYQNLDVDEIDAMYTACSYERARNWEYGKLSPWCAVFRADDFEVLEYWYDLKEYHRTGYGHKVHERLGCVPIKDLVKTFSARAAATAGSPPAGIVYHSHDTLINQVIAFLGLFHDREPLREDNFAGQRGRQWRVTAFSPFASNIAAVLHECDSGERYRVQLFLNENLMPLSDWGCGPDSCSWSQFMAKFGHVLSDCKQRLLCLGL